MCLFDPICIKEGKNEDKQNVSGCVAMTMIFPSNVMAESNSLVEENACSVLSNEEFEVKYPTEFFVEADYYEDGNLIFQKVSTIENNSSVHLMSSDASEIHCVSDTVMFFDITEDEKDIIFEIIVRHYAN